MYADIHTNRHTPDVQRHTCRTQQHTIRNIENSWHTRLCIRNIPTLNSPFSMTVLLFTAFLSRATGRIKSELVSSLTELLCYPFIIISHIGINTSFVRRSTSLTPWHNPCKEPFTLQWSTAVTLTEDKKISNLSSL